MRNASTVIIILLQHDTAGISENNLIRLGLTQNRVQYFHSISVVSEPQDPGAEDQVVPAAVTVEISESEALKILSEDCLLYTSPSPRDQRGSRMPSSA